MKPITTHYRDERSQAALTEVRRRCCRVVLAARPYLQKVYGTDQSIYDESNVRRRLGTTIRRTLHTDPQDAIAYLQGNIADIEIRVVTYTHRSNIPACSVCDWPLIGHHPDCNGSAVINGEEKRRKR